MFRSGAAVVAAACLACLCGTVRPTAQGRAQTVDPRDPVGTAVIAGTVVDDGTGRPMAGVRVTRWIWTDGAFQHESITDAQGRFIFHDVGAGAFHVVAEFSGFTASQNGMRTREDAPRPVVVADGQRLTNVALRLFPQAVGHVRGVVTDAYGDPAANVTVALLRGMPGTGGRLIDFPTVQQTDDRGQYDFTTVPGDVSVIVPPARTLTVPAAFAQPDMRASANLLTRPAVFVPDIPPMIDGPLRIFVGDPTRPALWPLLPAGKRATSYGVTIAPAASGDDLMPVRVDIGATRVLDIAMKLEPAGSLSGRLVGPDGPVPHVPVRLMPAVADRFASGNDVGFDMAAAITGANGEFRFTAVPAGRYIIRSFIGSDWPMPDAPTATVITGRGSATPMAMQASVYASPAGPTAGPVLWADVPVVATGGDMSGVEVTVRRGASIRGRMVFESATPPKPADLARFSIGLQPADSSARATASARPAPDATFVAGEYPAGRYILGVTSTTPNSSWVVKSAMHRDQDWFAAPFELGAEGVDGLIVTLTDAVASVHGSVRGANGLVVDQAQILLFPRQPKLARGIGAPVQQYKAAAAGADGQFDIGGIAAGDYNLVALTPSIGQTWRDADTLAALARVATQVTLSERQNLSVNLQAQTVKR